MSRQRSLLESVLFNQFQPGGLQIHKMGKCLRHGERRFGVQPSGCTERDRLTRQGALPLDIPLKSSGMWNPEFRSRKPEWSARGFASRTRRKRLRPNLTSFRTWRKPGDWTDFSVE